MSKIICDGPPRGTNELRIDDEPPAVWDLLLADMRDRDAEGLRRYGVRLTPHNGRDALQDAYEEALDLAVYLRQALYERDGR